MRALEKEREKAIRLRKKGKSLNEICAAVSKSKGTVFPWIRHISADVKRKAARENQVKAIQAMQRKYMKLRECAYEEMSKRAPELMKEQLVRDAVVAYYCEGAKTLRGTLDITNTEPRVHKLFLSVLPLFSKKEPRFVLIGHQISKKMIKFWATELGILGEKIQRVKKGGRASNRRFKFGTMKTRVHDTLAVSKMHALMDYVLEIWDKAPVAQPG